MELLPCDIFFTKGDSLLAYFIRRATRAKNEPPTWAGHVGIVVEPGEGIEAVCVEALSRVERHSLASQYQGKVVEIKVFRPVSLTTGLITAILGYAEQSVGQRYGYTKIALHALHWLLGWNWILNFGFIHKRPICSYLVAHCFRAANLTFGLDADVVSPDDMLDFCEDNPDKYQLVATYQIT